MNPDRYVKEIRLWIQRRRERERKRGGEREGGGMVCASCRIHSPASSEDGANRVVGMVI